MGIKLLVPAIASILILGLATQGAFAQQVESQGDPQDGDCNSNGIGGGPWSDPNSWNCVGILNDVPASRKAVTILTGDIITVDTDVDRSPGPENFVNTLTIEAGATLKVNCGKIFKVDELINLSLITVENCGDTEVAIFTNPGIFNNNCGPH